jgi:hypothetical protein
MVTLHDLDDIERQDADRAVHAARKLLKRARAGLRLERAALGDTAYHESNERLRDAGRPLVDLRDAAALVDALGALRKPRDKGEIRAYIDRMRRHLEVEHAAQRQRFERATLRASMTALEDVRRRIPSLGRHSNAPSASNGILKSYQNGKKAFAKVRRHASTLKLHEWRKQAKYLANELELAPIILRRDLQKLHRRAKKLAALLGQDHDLAVLSSLSRDGADGALIDDRSGRKALKQRLRRRRARLQDRARRLGHRLYELPAKSLGRRLGRLLRRQVSVLAARDDERDRRSRGITARKVSAKRSKAVT